jgi:hypothetical protein
MITRYGQHVHVTLTAHILLEMWRGIENVCIEWFVRYLVSGNRARRPATLLHGAYMASLISILDLLVLLSVSFALSALRDYQRRRGLRYPPGPRPLPVIGNLLDIPKESSWFTYAKLSKKYGKETTLYLYYLK